MFKSFPLQKSSMYKSVPLKAFETNIQRATSHFDVIRMFLRNQTISNERLTQLINKDDKYTDLDKRDYDEFVNDDDYYTDDDDTSKYLVQICHRICRPSYSEHQASAPP